MGATEVLREVFGEAISNVSTTPAPRDAQRAVNAVADVALGAVIQALGTMSGQYVSDVLVPAGLRPADFAASKELLTAMRDRVVKALREDPEAFFDAMSLQLRMRG